MFILSLRKIHGYRGQDVTLRLPQNITVFDIDWIALYCITYSENFGHVQIPPRRTLNIPADLTSLASTVRRSSSSRSRTNSNRSSTSSQ